MAFWNRKGDDNRRDLSDREYERTPANDARELAYGGGVPTERGPEDLGDWAIASYGMEATDPDHRERTYEGKPMDEPRRDGEHYGEGSRRTLSDERDDDRRFRSDMPGMGSRGDYGMDDPRHRRDNPAPSRKPDSKHRF